MGSAGGGELDRLLDEQVTYYRSLAAGYLNQGLDLPGGDELAEALEAFRPTGSVLELACGPGVWTSQDREGPAPATGPRTAAPATRLAHYGDLHVRAVLLGSRRQKLTRRRGHVTGPILGMTAVRAGALPAWPRMSRQHPPQAAAVRYVETIGGIDATVAKARQYADRGDLRFAGDPKVFATIAGLTDQPEPAFAIVTP